MSGTSGTLRRILVCLTVFAPLAGCSGPEPQGHPLVRDSSGVEIVRSLQPRWPAEDAPRRPDALRLEIVSDNSDSETVLHQVMGVAVLTDGRVVIANRGDASLRLHDASGDLEWEAGGEGEGPGEFQDLRGVVVRDGELWAYQTFPRPIHVYDLAGEHQRSVPTPGWGGPWLRGLLSGGTIVATTRSSGESDGSVVRQTTPLMTFAEGRLDTIAVLPANQVVNTSVGAEWQGLGPILSVAASSGQIFAGFGATWDIGVWNRSGQLLRRIQRDWTPVPVSATDREAYTRSLEQQGRNPLQAAAYRQLGEEMIYPESHAAFDRMIADRSGGLWVRRSQVMPPWDRAIDYNPVRPHPSDWDLFGPDGVWLGTVRLPARFRLMDVGADYVAGVAKDDLDVETVQVWELRLPR